jgi:putative transposase
VQKVAAAHRTVRNQRRDLARRLSRQLVNGYDLIVFEDLKITNMVRRPKPKKGEDGTYEPNGAAAKSGLNRSISDAGWGQRLQFTIYKAEHAGRVVIAVDPRHSSQRCSSGGHVDGGNSAHPGHISMSGVRARGPGGHQRGHQHPAGR